MGKFGEPYQFLIFSNIQLQFSIISVTEYESSPIIAIRFSTWVVLGCYLGGTWVVFPCYHLCMRQFTISLFRNLLHPEDFSEFVSFCFQFFRIRCLQLLQILYFPSY